MKSIYLSSTYSDLKDHRKAVADLLRDCGYSVDAMEQYAARDDRPRKACEEDVAKRDAYVGVFAWRYGYVPDKPENKKSITELEYLAAERARKPRLVFFVDEDAPWDAALKDARDSEGGAAVRALRARLTTDRWAAFFRSPEDLANKVITSIFQLETTSLVEKLAAVDRLQEAPDLGPSYLGNIQDQVQQLGEAKFVAIRVGDAAPAIWWNTRLHLVAALMSDFTEVAQLVLSGKGGQLLALAAPPEIRRALAKSDSRLELTYLKARELGRQYPGSDIERTIFSYSQAVREIFGREEAEIIDILHPRRIQELGIRSQGETMEIGDRPLASIRSELLQKFQRYVLLTRDGQPDGIVDRLDLSSRIAALAA